MNSWYQGIVVHHKEIDNKMYHCFDDENFEILVNERKEQLKEIERLNNIIEKLMQENAVLKTQVVNKDTYSYGIRMGSDKE